MWGLSRIISEKFIMLYVMAIGDGLGAAIRVYKYCVSDGVRTGCPLRLQIYGVCLRANTVWGRLVGYFCLIAGIKCGFIWGTGLLSRPLRCS